MQRVSRMIGLSLALALILSLAGCTNQQSISSLPPANANTNTAQSTATPAPSPTLVSIGDAQAIPVTLPVLDAFFADEAFAAELKTKLQLTDEQINQLRTVAREQTAMLRESSTDEYSGTTANARAQAEQQIKAIIGEEKAHQLAALVRERWSSGGGAGNMAGAIVAASTPNAVPTDTRIVVNAPAYRMDVFDNGKLVKSYKIGIGYPEFPLPTGLRTARAIIFNPTWTPPDEPWVESALSKVKVGQKVPAGSKLNPLGPIKIPIGSPSLIHGGKSPAKLGGFASHGCVGLSDPLVQDFAKVLARISGTELSEADVKGYLKNKTETKQVPLSNPMPVELRYETIVVEDGKLHIYRDVYDRNTNTEENLRAVLEAHGVTLEDLSEQERTQALAALQEMSRDASGKLDEAEAGANSNTPAGGVAANNRNSNALNANGNKRGNVATSNNKLTRTVKGKKEIVIEIAALKGKGYPAPVGLNKLGSAKSLVADSTKPADKRRSP